MIFRARNNTQNIVNNRPSHFLSLYARELVIIMIIIIKNIEHVMRGTVKIMNKNNYVFQVYLQRTFLAPVPSLFYSKNSSLRHESSHKENRE